MSYAKSIRADGPDRLTISDREGREWTYAKRGPAGRWAVGLVRATDAGLELVLGMDHQPCIRQLDDGLPDCVDVQLADGVWAFERA
jgi:hypothetical protein